VSIPSGTVRRLGADLDEAIEVASKHPTAWYGTIEVRPIAGDHSGNAAAAS
jgi:hypothetical protein